MIVLPVGMHRTGTSMVSRILQALDVEMNGGADSHCEDRDFVKLNRTILKRANGAWNNPPKPIRLHNQVQWAQPRVERLISVRERAAALAGQFRWGWKDPRMCLLLGPVYQEVLDRYADVRYVWTQRSTEHVSASLRDRDGRHELGYPNYATLYARYVADIRTYLQSHKKRPTFQVSYLNWTHWGKGYRRTMIEDLCDFLDLGHNNVDDALRIIHPQR